MKYRISVSILVLAASSLFAQNSYRYTVNLTNVEDDKVNVELLTPKINKNKARFYFAKIVPGTYQVYNFGRFISEFRAFEKDGAELPVSRVDENTILIEKAKSLYKIHYRVDDSYDATTGKKISGMTGTNIVSDDVFVINGHGFYGYFEKSKFQEYEIKVLKPEGFVGSSSHTPTSSTDEYDLFNMPSYNYVVDTPMMYCKPDITTTKVGNADVMVSVYSSSGNVKSAYLSDKLGRLLEAQKNYMGGKLPVDKYAFLMYFLKPGENVGTGALEHNYSSLYALPDLPQEQIIQSVLNISAHEFFHIITPLNIHSEEIQYFDFNDPDMSKHLWLYEGVTEYFSHHAQLADGLTSLETFLAEMSGKITDSKTNYDDSLPFTELSEGCLEQYRDQYANVYQKGALIGLCLDILLRKASEGNMGLIDLMNELANIYGDNKPFKDKHLFREITKITYPEIGAFFERHVSGKLPLPLDALFTELGIKYSPPEPYMGYSFGNTNLGFNPETKRLYVAYNGNMNAFGKKMGYEVGDVLLKINGEELPESGFQEYFQNITNNLNEGETLSVEVSRNGKIMELKAIIEKVRLFKPAELTIQESATQDQISLRSNWIKGASR